MVRPEFHKPLNQYAADWRLTMTHVIIDAVARRLKRTGCWPVLTAGAKERRKRRRIKRMVEGQQRKRGAAGEHRTRPRPNRGVGIGRSPHSHRHKGPLNRQEWVRASRHSLVTPSISDELLHSLTGDAQTGWSSRCPLLRPLTRVATLRCFSLLFRVSCRLHAMQSALSVFFENRGFVKLNGLLKQNIESTPHSNGTPERRE